MSQDTLSDLLRGVRLRGAVFYFVSFRGSWSAEASESALIASSVLPGCEHVMEFHMMAKGGGWATVSDLPPVRLAAGDVVMFPQGDRHVLSSNPGLASIYRSPEMVHAMHGLPKPMPLSYQQGLIQMSAMPIEDADAVAVCGFLGCDKRPFNPLIAALPRILHLPADRTGSWLTRVIEQAVIESSARLPGGGAVLERLSEMMFVDAARRYLEMLPDGSSGWLAGLRDRFVGKAIGLLHEQPGRKWTVDELALAVGLSRSALHERFVQYLELAPIQYLASWRVQLGSRLLRETSRSVAAVALEVGYESEAAFSRAFRRLVGMPPAAWRRT